MNGNAADVVRVSLKGGDAFESVVVEHADLKNNYFPSLRKSFSTLTHFSVNARWFLCERKIECVVREPRYSGYGRGLIF